MASELRRTEAPRQRLLDEVIIVIPALNEEASLPLVLADLPPVRRVIVVDNGSTDATAALMLQTTVQIQ